VNYSAIAAIAAGVIGTTLIVWGVIDWWRERHGKPRLEVGSTLTTIGIVGATVFMLIALGGLAWQHFFEQPNKQTDQGKQPTVQEKTQTASQLKRPPSTEIIERASLSEGGFGASENPLILTGTFAKSGKHLTFAVDVSIYMGPRGEEPLLRQPRIVLGTADNFLRKEPVNIIVVSYVDDDRSAAMWGPRRPPSGKDDETFTFTSFRKATIIAIDESGNENRILSFTLFPKMIMSDLTAPKLGTPTQKLDWHNILVFPDGALKRLDSGQ